MAEGIGAKVACSVSHKGQVQHDVLLRVPNPVISIARITVAQKQ